MGQLGSQMQSARFMMTTYLTNHAGNFIHFQLHHAATRAVTAASDLQMQLPRVARIFGMS